MQFRRVIFRAENDFERELKINKGKTKQYNNGDGEGHVEVGVDNWHAEYKRMSELGFKPNDVKEFNRNDELMARFFFVQDPDGYKIEVLEKHGRYV